mmetsp:Transcript_38640/g.52383  ORF Transcript_38640/g.52383 Transcript_38640/m.52383 type:complete len:96 (+) Transcript_38640:1194-1481(+)
MSMGCVLSTNQTARIKEVGCWYMCTHIFVKERKAAKRLHHHSLQKSFGCFFLFEPPVICNKPSVRRDEDSLGVGEMMCLAFEVVTCLYSLDSVAQ